MHISAFILSLTIVGVILGYLAGIKYGEWASVEAAGIFAILYLDTFKEYYSTWGALIGGTAGFIFSFWYVS